MLFPVDFLNRWGTSFPAWSLDASRAYTRELASSHYENFPVASLLAPRRLRQDYCNVYAFCRWADDLGDELGDPVRSLELLEWWRAELEAMEAGRARHPVYVALCDTVSRHALPTRDFADLIRAFVQDQSVRRYRTYAELLDYCRYSANPVGRLVLRLHGHRDDSLFALSDAICTGLQLANHWQDIARDWRIDRVYLPSEVMEAHGYSQERLAADMEAGRASASCRDTLRDLCGRAEDLFQAGMPLAARCGGRLGFEVECFARAGIEVLRLIGARNWDTISSRPTVGKLARAKLLTVAAASRLAKPRIAASQAHDAQA